MFISRIYSGTVGQAPAGVRNLIQCNLYLCTVSVALFNLQEYRSCKYRIRRSMHNLLVIHGLLLVKNFQASFIQCPNVSVGVGIEMSILPLNKKPRSWNMQLSIINSL